jgi:hypothetical protein
MERLHLHLYLDISSDYSDTDFVNYLRGRKGPEDSEDPTIPVPDLTKERPKPVEERKPVPDRFKTAGVDLDFHSNAAQGTDAFKKSLRDDGSVVVYLGHSTLDFIKRRSLGLEPLGHKKVEIYPDELMGLLTLSRAKLVILATCASSTLGLEQLKAGPAVVVTNSGSDLKTWSNDWGLALKYFLLALIGYTIAEHDKPFSLETRANLFSDIVGAGVTGAVASKLVGRRARATIREALKASDLGFKENNSTDRFQLAHGEGSKVVFPDKE